MAPSPALLLHDYASRTSPKLAPLCVETDLDIIDLECPKPTPKSSQLSRRRFIQTGTEGIPSSLKLRNAEADLEIVAQKMESLEDRLVKVAQPRLQKALDSAEQEMVRVQGLREALDTVNRDLSEIDTSATLQGLSKAELCEIRQLARNPPDHVRRTLMAIWLVLNSDRFRDKAVANLHEGKDWAQCQKMLADKTFVSRLHSFDPASLDEVPHVLTHIARTFFGIDDAPVLQNQRTEVALQRCASDGVMRRSLSGALSLHSSISGRHRHLTNSTCNRSSRLTKPMSLPSLPQLPLDQQEVQHASEPCGALLRWLRTLVLDRARRVCIQHDLCRAEEKLSSAQGLCREAESQVADLRAELETNRKLHVRQQQTITGLRSDLDIDQKHSMQPHARACDINGAWNLTRLRPRSRCKLPCDITLKTLTCQNGAWRETFERYSAPGSPSWARICAK